MKLSVGQRVLIANPLKSTRIPDPCFGHVENIGDHPAVEVSGVMVAIFKPITELTHIFIPDGDVDEALTAVD